MAELEERLDIAVRAAKEAGDTRELRKHLSTRALIRQDRVDHRLQLNKLDDLPRGDLGLGLGLALGLGLGLRSGLRVKG